MATTEPTINDALAEVLRNTRKAWRAEGIVRSENSGLIKGSAKKPDLLIAEGNVSPVIIEAEVMPATSVESEAKERLGEQLSASGQYIWSAIALRLPDRLRILSGAKLREYLATTPDLEMVLFTGKRKEEGSRWPGSGWLQGTMGDLSILAQSASVPSMVIEEAVDTLVTGVSEAAALLNQITKHHTGASEEMSRQLCQESGEQTDRMAMTIIANAFVFHESVARSEGALADVRSLEELRGKNGELSKSDVLNEWREILKVNYWPIFDIARRILEVIPANLSSELIDRMATTAAKLSANNLMRSHDLTGAVFQKLIADRKFLAAYYTTPASAALLAGLAINPQGTADDASWSNPEYVKGLRVADLACGTGTLLSTAYQRIGHLHEMAGGDAEALHDSMMCNSLIGCDVLPSAAHLTASMLAGIHPTSKYNGSLIMTVGYGPQLKGGVALGSLELMDDQREFPIISITAKIAEGTGEKEEELWSKLQHLSFDLILMNPPFTRATDHEGEKAEVPNPMFAAFSSTEEQQGQMSEAVKRLFSGTCAHGNAGEASYFLALAHKRLKAGGTLALVMPVSLVSGDSWEASRKLLQASYSDLIFVSIAGERSIDLSFSADTSMGECLVVGRKDGASAKRATFVVLKERPAYPMVGANTAQQINRAIATKSLRKLEDGPVGGSPIRFGDDIIGYAIDAPTPADGPWNIARIWDLSLAQAAYQIAYKARVWLPGVGEHEAIPLGISKVGNIANIGPVHRDINGDTPQGGIRGPFEIVPLTAPSAPTYPVLWSHEADRERCLEFEADSEGIIRKAKTRIEDRAVREKAEKIWATASHCHFNADFRFNSQSMAMQFTKKRAIGGRAWPSISLKSTDQEKALVVWGNTSLGLLLHWWHSNKQQSGRGSIGVSALQALPILDVTSLSPKQLANAGKIYDGMKDREFRPFNEIDHDPARAELDLQFAVEVLKMPANMAESGGPLALLREKLAKEPSIGGGKNAT